MEKENRRGSMERAKTPTDILKVTVAAFALMMAGPKPVAAVHTTLTQEHSRAQRELAESDFQRRWYNESGRLAKTLLDECFASNQCETASRVFSSDEAGAIERVIAGFMMNALSAQYRTPQDVFLDVEKRRANKEILRDSLYERFLHGKDEEEEMERTTAVNELLDFLFKEDLTK